MRRYVLVVVSIILLSSPQQIIFSQDNTTCDPEAIAQQYGDQISRATTFEELTTLQLELREAIAACTEPSPDEGIFSAAGTEDGVLDEPFDLAAGYYLIEYRATWDGDSRFSRLAVSLESQTDDPFGWSGEVGRGDVFGRRIQRLNFGSEFRATVEVSGVVDWQFSITLIDEMQPSEEMGLSVEGANREVLGPIALEEGYYVLDYELTRNPFAISETTTINIVWTKPNAHERIGVDLEVGQGDWRGENLYWVEGGIYYINFEVTGVAAWNVMLSPQ